MIRAVVYDLDDTMVDSDILHGETWEVLLKKYGYKFEDIPENIRSHFIGMRIIDIIKEIASFFHLKDSINKLYEERSRIFLIIVKKKLQLRPGLKESLNMLKQNGYILAIASSGSKKYIKVVLDKFFLHDFFTLIVSGDDVKLGKPNPEIYSLTAKKLDLSPSECVILEDATNGIIAAKNAGCKCIAVKNSHIPYQSYENADLVISSLHKLTLEQIEKF